MSLDRELLPALFAWQLGFVTREELAAGVRAWAPDGGKPLRQVLAEQGALSPPRCALLEALTRGTVAAPGLDPDQFLGAAGSLPGLLTELRQVVGAPCAAPETV